MLSEVWYICFEYLKFELALSVIIFLCDLPLFVFIDVKFVFWIVFDIVLSFVWVLVNLGR